MKALEEDKKKTVSSYDKGAGGEAMVRKILVDKFPTAYVEQVSKSGGNKGDILVKMPASDKTIMIEVKNLDAGKAVPKDQVRESSSL